MFRYLKRAMSRLVWPLSISRPAPLGPTHKNMVIKSKMLLVIAIVFLTSYAFLSSMVMDATNYSHLIQASRNLHSYIKLDRSLFTTYAFLKQFKHSSPAIPYITSSRQFEEFHVNHSATAYWNKLINVYTHKLNTDEYLEQNPLPFHWADWVNTSPANPIINAYKSLLQNEFHGNETTLLSAIDHTCQNTIFDRRDKFLDLEPSEGYLKVFEHLQGLGICASVYQYYYQILPEYLIFETEYKYFKWPVDQERLAEPLGVDGLAKMYLGKQDLTRGDRKHFKEQCALHEHQADAMRDVAISKGINTEPIQLSPTQFPARELFKMPDINQLINEYSSLKNPTFQDQKYLRFLNYSKNNNEKLTDLNFPAPMIGSDGTLELHHYDFPWVKQILTFRERMTVVHHLIRSWFKFCEQTGVVSWFSYGNLIGWYRHSRNLPWDSDVDVQTSIVGLDTLGRMWNNSLVVENPREGNGLFYFRTNPTYMQQNNNQFIDARYVDVKSGIYIDISALWLSKIEIDIHKDIPREDLYNCKHYNVFPRDLLFPLRRTLYEGGQAYTINKFVSYIEYHYGPQALDQPHSMQHNWQADIGIWVPDEICSGSKIPKNSTRWDSNGELTLFGACNDTDLWNDWHSTRESFAIHKLEQKLLEEGKNATHLSEKDLPSFRHFNFEDYN